MSVPVWLAPGAQVYGDVRFADGVSLWPNAVLRAESHFIQIGANTNVQDFAMIHIGGAPSIIGAFCSITHHATVHGAVIGDNCLIGINATVMDGATIGANSIIAGHAIVREGEEIPPDSVVAGVPGKVVARRSNYVANRLNAHAYLENARAYANGNHRRWAEPEYEAMMAALEHRLEEEQAENGAR